MGGKDNFAADREAADKLLAVAPDSGEAMRENRQFLARATRWVAAEGITQFVDLGCGMPTEPNTHSTAAAAATDPRVAYVDTDAVVLAHLRALAAQGNEGVTVIDGDVREVKTVLDAVAASIDLSRPACLLMGALLHFFPIDTAGDLVGRYVAALAPAATSCSPSATPRAPRRTMSSAPTPQAGTGPTTTRSRTSEIFSAG